VQIHQIWDTPWGRYWTFLLIKILLALCVFTVLIGVTFPLKLLQEIRARRELFLSVALGLALVIILISAYLRRT